MEEEKKYINIRPEVKVLSVLRHVNIPNWIALAEFIDNSIDSYHKNKDGLNHLHNGAFKLRVEIKFNANEKRITIEDNAAGIGEKDYERALIAGESPDDRSGLSEFGMGMKVGAFTFSDTWGIRTKALYETREKTVSFDLKKILNEGKEEIEIQTRELGKNDHFTVITIENVIDRMLSSSRSLSTLRINLGSIYRKFLRKGEVEIYVNDKPISYEDPKILRAPYYASPDSDPIEWKFPVHMKFDNGRRSVKGFIALLETMSGKNCGFALFRRGRVIEGFEPTKSIYKPKDIFGDEGSGSSLSKRLFGELHLEGFKVSQTKDGFTKNSDMDKFLDELTKYLTNDGKEIKKQGLHYKVRKYQQKRINEGPTASTRKRSNPIKKDKIDSNRKVSNSNEKSNSKDHFKEVYDVKFRNGFWKINVDANSNGYRDRELFLIPENSNPSNTLEVDKTIGVKVNLNHPFINGNRNNDFIESIMRIGAALVLSEVVAKKMKSKPEEIRNNLNELLGGSLSKK